MPTLTLLQAEGLVVRTLTRCRTDIDNARSVARALIAAEMPTGSRATACRACRCTRRRPRCARSTARRRPLVTRPRPGLIAIDAGQRLCLSGDRACRSRAARRRAQPGHRRGGDPPIEPLRRGRPSGRAAGGQGPGRADVRQHAGRDGAVGRIEAACSAPIRSRFACPLPGRAPLVIDLSLSKVARGNVMTAKQRGETIPEGWALDDDGQADHRSRTRRCAAPWCRWATPRAPRWR